MKFTPFLAALFGAAAALPPPPSPPAPRAACTNPVVRKEWRKATVAQRRAYLDAAVCITKKPSSMGFHPDATIQDDFAFVHALLSDSQTSIFIHTVPAFLPWHRFFLHVYEKALHACGYSGPTLYWDFVADAPAAALSPVWDPVTGFGGNGVGEPPVVADGPFKDWRPLFWGNMVEPHGLKRNWIPSKGEDVPEMSGNDYNQTVMDGVFSETTFDAFRGRLERAHDSVHGGVGGGAQSAGPGNAGQPGDLSGNSASPNDPLFFVLHAGVDRLWWLWQQQGKDKTMMYDGKDNKGVVVTLDDDLPMMGLAEPKKVKDYMDANSLELCYKYE